MMREYVKKMFAKEFDMHKALKYLHTQKIYSDTSEDVKEKMPDPDEKIPGVNFCIPGKDPERVDPDEFCMKLYEVMTKIEKAI